MSIVSYGHPKCGATLSQQWGATARHRSSSMKPPAAPGLGRTGRKRRAWVPNLRPAIGVTERGYGTRSLFGLRLRGLEKKYTFIRTLVNYDGEESLIYFGIFALL